MTTKNNKRIQELAEQAWLADSVEIDPNYKKYVGTEPVLKHLTGYNQKFAELIVRECVDIVSKVPNSYRDYRNQIEDVMRADCLQAIQEHFGVKE